MANRIQHIIEDRTRPPEHEAEIERLAAQSLTRKEWQVRMPSEIDRLLEELRQAKERRRG